MVNSRLSIKHRIRMFVCCCFPSNLDCTALMQQSTRTSTFLALKGANATLFDQIPFPNYKSVLHIIARIFFYTVKVPLLNC